MCHVSTVGILPGCAPADANPYVDIPIATGLRSEVIIAIAGEYGTLSEIALALKMGRRVIGLGTWTVARDVTVVGTPQQAIKKVIGYLGVC